jgi:hypothetical protein
MPVEYQDSTTFPRRSGRSPRPYRTREAEMGGAVDSAAPRYSSRSRVGMPTHGPAFEFALRERIPRGLKPSSFYVACSARLKSCPFKTAAQSEF